jgi:HupE / UreJ protein
MSCFERHATLLLAAMCFAMPLAVSPASADEVCPASLKITETAAGQFSLFWRTPVWEGTRLPVVLELPMEVKMLKEPRIFELPDSRVEQRWIDVGPNGLAGMRIDFAGLQTTYTDVLVRVEMLDGSDWTTIVRPSQPWVELAVTQDLLSLASTYIVEGAWQILFGVEHLLFIFGLVLIENDWWMLLKTIAAFTVAHSITLFVATLGYGSPPVVPLNAAIALSILFLGREIIRARRGGTSFTLRHPWVAAFAFGLIHGFGFAIALTSIGPPRKHLLLALLSFNAGVELGQLSLILLIVLLERSFRQLQIRWPRWLEALPGYAVGSLGAFWVFERTAILLGVIQ